MSAGVALQSFSLTNSITEISAQDAIYKYDAEEDKRINREAPWSKE
jgi:COP9 signalosome complex subunit 5